jgi:hypothetical protein
MEKDEKVREAEEIINWAILHLNTKIKCKVTNYKHGNFGVQFYTDKDKPIMLTQVSEAWVKETNSTSKAIGDQLKLLLSNLENY